MSDIVLGSSAARIVTVDAVEYASRANAILGIRDSGKTYTATMIAEQLMDCGIPFFAFDPIGRWRFLRAPGTRVDVPCWGYPVVVAGGAAPDIELTPDNAPGIIRGAMIAGVSVVLDLYSVGLSKAQWRSIVRGSIETILYEGEGHGQRHVFLEEAAEFVPQRVQDGHTYAAVEKLARMGGNVGVGLTLINQRAEEVNKAVLELCDNLLLHRQRGKNSLVSLGKWLDAGNVKPPRRITDTLATLPTGECWAWLKDGGEPERIKVAAKHSFDPNRRDMRRPGAGAQLDTVTHTSAHEAIERLKRAMGGEIERRGVEEENSRREKKQVDEKEARELRSENDRLHKMIRELKFQLAETLKGAEVPGKSAQLAIDNEAVYQFVKGRLIEDAPQLMALYSTRPEINISVNRQQIDASTDTLFGMCAMLIADKFFDDERRGADALQEIEKRGKRTAAPNVYKELDRLTQMGFLRKETRGAYKAVPGMKVNIIEARQ